MILKKLIKNIRKKWHNDLHHEMNVRYHDLNEKLMFLINKSSFGKDENELSFLCDMYGSNKGSTYKKFAHSIESPVHTYTDTYLKIFSPIRDEVKAVFECGIYRGASLRVWRDYFKNAVIIGGDINNHYLKNKNIYTAMLDQLDTKKIKTFFESLKSKYPNSFDIMIDDGCHTYEANTCLFENSFHYLKQNGIYVIEDAREKDLSRYKDYFQRYASENKVKVEYKFLSTENGITNDNLIIIKKT